MLIENESDDVLSIKRAIAVSIYYIIIENSVIDSNVQIHTLTSYYYGTFSEDISKMRKDVQSMRQLFRNQILGERDNPSCLILSQIELQLKVSC